MTISRKLANLLAISVTSISSASAATTITFEELGNISGVVQIGIIGEVDFGTLGAFDAAKPDYAYLAASPTNAAYYVSRTPYEIRMANGKDFDFLGASFVRSHSEGDYFQLLGKKDGVTIYSHPLVPIPIIRNGTPSFYAMEWTSIDTLSISWTGVGLLCCSSGYAVMDNFTYQAVSSVPEPNQALLLFAGLLAVAYTSAKRTTLKGF